MWQRTYHQIKHPRSYWQDSTDAAPTCCRRDPISLSAISRLTRSSWPIDWTLASFSSNSNLWRKYEKNTFKANYPFTLRGSLRANDCLTWWSRSLTLSSWMISFCFKDSFSVLISSIRLASTPRISFSCLHHCMMRKRIQTPYWIATLSNLSS